MPRNPSRTELKELLIAAAEDLLEHQGLAALQARTVAARAGCAIGSIYNVFGDIDELIMHANARTLEDLRDVLEAASAELETAPFEQRLIALAFGYLAFAAGRRRRWKAVFEHVMKEGATVPTWYRSAQTPLLNILARALPGWLAPDARSLMAETLFASAHGIVLLALDGKLSESFDQARTERQLRLLVEGAARSLAAR